MTMRAQMIAWHGDDEMEGDPRYIVRAFGRTEEGQSVSITVPFTPYWFLRVPESFSSMGLNALRSSIDSYLAVKGLGVLVGASIVRRKPFHGFTNDETAPFVRLVFSTRLASRKVASAIQHKGIEIPGVRSPRVYETNIDPLLRLMHVSGVESTGWVDLSPLYPVRNKKTTTCDLEYQAPNYQMFRPAEDPGKLAPFRVFSYDIETYSPDGSFPNPLRACPIIQIGITLWSCGTSPETDTRSILLSVGECAPIESAEVVSCHDERELLVKFAEVMRREDPDIVLHYNGWGFDDRYVAIRAQKTGCNVHTGLGRVANRSSSQLVSKTLSSSALGDNTYELLEYIGRLPMDLMQVIKREHKLDSYSLNSVSATFLQDKKVDLTPAQLFDKVRQGTPEARADIATYCVYDTKLPIRLVAKLACVPNLVEMARACWVPVDALLLRGQQIKVFSQIAYFTRKEDIVIESGRSSPLIEGYEGATVLSAKSGAYLNEVVTCLDFASLYPSIMRAYNLCHTTLVAIDGPFDNVPGVEYEDFEVDGERIRFVQNRPGILPRLLEELAKRRKAAKRAMADAAARGDSMAESIYNGKQLAFKISMNSIYGFCGSAKGMLPCVEVSSTTTYVGRCMIEQSKTFVEREYEGAEVVYGDSITGPTFVTVSTLGETHIVPVEELSSRIPCADWKFMACGTKEYAECMHPTWAWSERGWTRLERIIRHGLPTGKSILRVRCRGGHVDVTDDHSLLLTDGTPISPKDVTPGDVLLFREIHDARRNPIQGQVMSIEPIEYAGYVYDLTTENHHFQAGTGGIIVHNTDSIFVKFPVHADTHQERVRESFRLGADAASRITNTFRPPIELEFEKCYSPLLLFKKKRYCGLMFEADTGPEEPKKIDVKGMELVRRDNPPFVKQVLRGVVDAILKDRDVAKGIRIVEKAAERLLANEVPLDDLVLSKTLRDAHGYKDPEHAKKTQPHMALAEKMKQRMPGSEPRSGDRVPYVFIETYDPRELQGVKAEDPVYAKENGLRPDVAYYLEHSLIKPTLTILGLFVQDPKTEIYGGYLERLKGERAVRLRDIRQNKKLESWAGQNQRPITDFFR